MVVHHEYVSCQYRDWVSHEGAGKGCISSLEGSRFRASAAWLTMNQEHTIELAYVHVVALQWFELAPLPILTKIPLTLSISRGEYDGYLISIMEPEDLLTASLRLPAPTN